MLEPLIEFAIRQAATGRMTSPITPVDDGEATSEASEPSRWGPRELRWFDPRCRVVVVAPADRPAFEADVAAFLASQHEERRRISWVTFEPIRRRGEAVESTLGGWGWLYRAEGHGYRLVCGARARRGIYLAWDMPGYNRRDALYLATAFIEGYLGPEQSGEALWQGRPRRGTRAR